MKTSFLKIATLFLAAGLLFLSGCTNPDPDAQSAEDDARGSFIMADAFAVGNNQSGGGSGGGKAELPEGMTVVRDTINHTVTITFENCDYRGAVRNGIINILYTLSDLGPRAVSMVLTFENYTINDISVEGTITTTFGGTYLKPEIEIVAAGMIAAFKDGKKITWTSNKTFIITEGFGNEDISDNIIEMSGTAAGVNRNGVSYSSTYSKVTVDRSCEYGYPVSGTVTIISENGTSVIDYGTGDCDNVITVTNGGVSVEVTLN